MIKNAYHVLRRSGSGRVLLLTTALGLLVATAVWLLVGWSSHRPAAALAPHTAVLNQTDRAAAIVNRFSANVAQPALQTVNIKETAVLQITEDVLRKWQDSWSSKNGAAFAALLANDASLSDLSKPLPPAWRDRSGIQESRWSPGADMVRGTKPAQDMVSAYLATYRNIEAVAVEPHTVDLQPQAAHLLVWLDVRGIDNAGLRRNDRGYVDVACSRAAGAWQLTSLKLRSMDTLTAKTASFVDVTPGSGLDRFPIYQRIEAIRRGGYAVAVGDYDGDGRPDLYLGAWGAGQLYRNLGNGKFQDVTKASGLAEDTLVKAAAFVDLRNRGRKDLVLSRFAKDGSEEVVIYENQGQGRFHRMDNALARATKYDRAMPMSIADFNHDGLLDLYVGFPGERDFTVLDNKAQSLAPQGVFFNRGDGTFEDATERSGINRRLAQMNPIYPHASVAADWDGNGKVNLVVVDDRRHTNPIFSVNQDGTFQNVGNSLGIQNKGWGMGVAVGDFNGDGLQDVYMTNVDFLASKRMAADLPKDQNLYSGNHLFENLGGGKFREVTDKAGVGWAGQGAGGAVWLDYDNDGLLDLYVVNGLWTGPGQQDMASLFVRDYVAESQLAQQKETASNNFDDAGLMGLRSAESSHIVMSALTDFRGDLRNPQAAGGNNQPSLSMGGRQHHCLFRNNGDGTFTEVGYLAGVDRTEDGYVAAVADLTQSGKMDLILRNADPGTKQLEFPSVVVLRNNNSGGNHFLKLTLHGDGHKSNRDAVGATVWLWANGRQQSRQIQTLSGATQSEMAAFFGLGQATRVDRLKVRWPSGKTQTWNSLPVDKAMSLEEGK